MTKKLIVGLGNVGEEYKNNRHNVGFKVLDALASQISKSEFLNPKQVSNSKFQIRNKFRSEIAEFEGLLLVKPQTMMNASGKAVSSLTTYYKLHTTDIYVVHDDLDIKLGNYKIQKGKGPKDHQGLLSIDRELGTQDYWHVRVGVDNRLTRSNVKGQMSKVPPGEKYVLQDFTEDEFEVLDKTLNNICCELRRIFLEEKKHTHASQN